MRNKSKNLGAFKLTNIDFGNTLSVSDVNFKNTVDVYNDPEVVENRYVKPMPYGMKEANEQISLDKTRKDIIKSTSDNYGVNTNSILSDSKSYRRNNTLTKKAQYAINKNQLKSQALRKKYDEIQ